MIGATGFEPAT